ncbi:MAG: penicillin-binding protein [Erysipelotrichaceae bacterium]|nr:penicillin-binding protein [Erysipelotrichaceae bacterium]
MEHNVKVSNVVLIIVFFLFLIIITRVSYIALAKKIDNIDIQSLASKRTTKEIILKANRGTIFDSSGDVLAQDVASYTLIAYLDPKRTTDPEKPQHVVDKEKTALVLSAILNMDKETILSYLNKENTYQTEFGVKGKGLNEIEKDTILATNLPGLDFIETTKRYYPYGKFLSYLIGYAKQDENGKMTGELGIEKYYNKELTGVNGKTVYQKDLKGYKIAGTKEVTEAKVDGSDIYLTIDNNIQFFLEEALNNVSSKYEFDEIDLIVANAKTGEILGYATTPSFDPNILDIKNYLDSNITSFEPGSTMKIYTYMAALEAGVYKGNDTYMSGSFETKDKTIIRDWNKVGWGRITYDKGFIYSSNTGVVNMMDKYLDATILKNYLKKLGFGSKTDICLPNEGSGKISFKYETEVFNAAFGQGITTTPIQHIKALTSIANDGELLKPYIVKKIVSDSETTENKRTVHANVASSETISYIKNLMWHTVNDPDGAAHAYYIEGYDLIGKTGTAQIASTNGKGYLTGDRDIIRSISLMFPKDDPEIIIYGAAKRPENVKVLSEPVKDIVKNISKYYNIYKEQETTTEHVSTINNYLNQDLDQVVASLKENKITPIVIGTGKTIINQYPLNKTITSADKVFLLTNSTDYVLPNLTGYSKSDVETLLTLLNVSYTIKGHGYVVKQSIPENTKITSDLKIEITLESKLAE